MSAPDHRQPGETWTHWAKRTLAATEREIDIITRSTQEWEREYGTRLPGHGYLNTLRVQAKRFREDIDRYGDAPGNNQPLT